MRVQAGRLAEGQPDRRVEELAGRRAAGNRGGMVAGQVGSGAGGLECRGRGEEADREHNNG